MSVNAQWHAAAGTALTRLSSGQAHWQADLDTAAGGAGLAPTPHQLLDSALAACTALTLQLYSQRKHYPLEAVAVDVAHDETPGHYRLTRRIALTGDLNPAQREDLLRVANACPIHKVLRSQIEIATEWQV